MTAYEKGFRECLQGIISTQLYVFMPGYRNGHDAAFEHMLRRRGMAIRPVP